VTFILAATKLVAFRASSSRWRSPRDFGVAAWYLFRLWRSNSSWRPATPVRRPRDSGLARLLVVFCFGLIHGLGFASASGSTSPGRGRCGRCSCSTSASRPCRSA
jgi:hypothetical protein